MLKLAIYNVKRSRWRTNLLIFGIIVTIALETGIVVTVDTIYEDFLFNNRNQNFTDITVNPKELMNLDSLKTLTDAINKVPGVMKSSEVYYVNSDFISNQSTGYSDIWIFGINFETHPDFKSLNILDGSRTIKERTVLISQTIKSTIGIDPGEDIVLEENQDIGFRGGTLVVGGVFSSPPFFGNIEVPLIILVDIETLLDLFQVDNSVRSIKSRIDVKIDNLVNIEQIADDIRDNIGLDFNVFAEKNISELQTLGISVYSVAMNIIFLASLLVEFLFLTNLLTIVIRERRKEYGILRTLGISSKQLLLIIFYEVLIYSIIGILIGIVIGIGFANFLINILDGFYLSLNFQASIIKPASLAVIFISGITIALLAGLYPIYLAFKVPVIRNIHYRMRSADVSLGKSYWKYTTLIGLLLVFSGYFLSFFTSPARFLEYSITSTHFMIIIYIFIGTLLIEAGFLVVLPKIGEKVLVIFNKVPRQISMRNISREFYKSLLTVISSSVALTFIIIVGIVANVVITSIPQYYEDQWGTIDLVAETSDNNLLPINFTDELLLNERIKQVSFMQKSRLNIGSINTNIFGVDPDKYAFFKETTYNAISEQPSQLLLKDNSTNKINALVTAKLFNSLDLLIGDNIIVKSSSSPAVNITIAAVIKGNSFLGDGRYLYISSTHYQSLFNSTLAKFFICDVFDGLDIYETQTNISTTYPNFNEVYGVDFYRDTMERSLKFQADLFQVLFMQAFVLAGLVQFVSVLISTINMEREMGIMRSMGLSKWGVFSVFLAEATALGISSLFFGLLDGIFGAILLLWYISSSIPIQLIIPIDHIILWLFFSFVFTLISTIVPAFRSSRNEVAATISARPIQLVKEKKGLYKKLSDFVSRVYGIFYYIGLIIIAYFVLVFSIIIIGYIIVLILWFFNEIF
ncbi:MAG: ABC transporter permease [Candidatus Hodarchaeales archaeon]|jgi:putative ABC transport system permease protein